MPQILTVWLGENRLSSQGAGMVWEALLFLEGEVSTEAGNLDLGPLFRTPGISQTTPVGFAAGFPSLHPHLFPALPCPAPLPLVGLQPTGGTGRRKGQFSFLPPLLPA